MKKIRYAVFASGGGSDLQSAIDAQNAGLIPNGEIAVVISNKEDSGALSRARLADIQKTADIWVEEWLEEREREGWKFQDGDLWGVPPDDNDL